MFGEFSEIININNDKSLFALEKNNKFIVGEKGYNDHIHITNDSFLYIFNQCDIK